MKNRINKYIILFIGTMIVAVGAFFYINYSHSTSKVNASIESKDKNNTNSKENRTIAYCVRRFSTIESFRQVYSYADFPDRTQHILKLPHGGLVSEENGDTSKGVEVRSSGGYIAHYKASTDPSSATILQIEEAIKAKK